jgi:hypothetical protein
MQKRMQTRPRPDAWSRRGARRLFLSALLATTVCVAPGSARAESEESGPVTKFFFGITAAVCTLVYTPLKIVYAVTSMPVSGLVYTFSVGNTEMSERVLRSGTQGSWVITPEHLQGHRGVEFVGAANEGPDPDAPRR